MLSVKSLDAGTGAGVAAYYEDLAREDYYNEGGEPPGVYLGRFAESLGVAGEQVQKGELTNLLTGRHPRTGVAISRQIATKTGHKPGWDLTFSAPKSVSVVWATAKPEEREAISRAQAIAVKKAMSYIQDKAFHTRHGHAGVLKGHYTGGVIAAAFEHSTSRNGDPNLHTHVVTANLCEEGRRIDLDTRWKMAAGAIYRAELAHVLKAHGYQIERDERSFAIAGVPRDLEEKWSSRRAEIETALKEVGMDTAKAAAVAALDTRSTKTDVNRAELFQEWRNVAAAAGFDPESLKSGEYAKQPDFNPYDLAKSITEKASTASEMQLEAAIYQAAQGIYSGDEARSLAEAMKSSPELVRLEKKVGGEFGRDGEARFTTPEMLAIEKSMANRAEEMAKATSHHADAGAIVQAIEARTLSNEQREALRHVTGGERLSVVQGTAGAGKSYMLDAARDAWEKSGYQVHGAALSGKAADGLEKSSGIKSETIHRTLQDLRSGALQLDHKSVVVVDEAGMVDSRQMAELISKVDEAGGKIVLVGDTKQLQPIDAGGAMRAIDERTGSVAMNEIRRQSDGGERQMVADLKEGRIDAAMEHLAAKDRLHIHESSDLARQSAAWGVVNDLGEGKSAIALSDTRSAVAEINAYARAGMRATGQLDGEDKTYKTADAERQFAAGDRVIFLKNDRDLGVKNGTTGEVVRAEDGALRVRLDGPSNAPKESWQTVSINESSYQKIDHGYAMTVHKSQGATVDRAHYVAGDMASRELGYVAGSRHRESFQMHVTEGQAAEVRDRLGASQQKDTTLDYNSISRIPDDLRNERTSYSAEARGDAIHSQRAASSGLPEPDPGRTAREAAPQEHTSLRDLSSLPVVHELRGSEVFLSKDAQRELAEERASDLEVRRPRDGGDRAERATRDAADGGMMEKNRFEEIAREDFGRGSQMEAQASREFTASDWSDSSKLDIADLSAKDLEKSLEMDAQKEKEFSQYQHESTIDRDSGWIADKYHDQIDYEQAVERERRAIEREESTLEIRQNFETLKDDLAGVQGFENVGDMEFSKDNASKLVEEVKEKHQDISQRQRSYLSQAGKDAAREVAEKKKARKFGSDVGRDDSKQAQPKSFESSQKSSEKDGSSEVQASREFTASDWSDSSKLLNANLSAQDLEKSLEMDAQKEKEFSQYQHESTIDRDSDLISPKGHDQIDYEQSVERERRALEREESTLEIRQNFETLKDDLAGVQGFENVGDMEFSKDNASKLVEEVKEKHQDISQRQRSYLSQAGKDAAREVAEKKKGKDFSKDGGKNRSKEIMTRHKSNPAQQKTNENTASRGRDQMER